MDWNIFWTAVASIAAFVGLLASALVLIFRTVRRQLSREAASLREDNERLRHDLETRLRLPSFSLAAVHLTEVAAERKIEELQQQYRKALTAEQHAAAHALIGRVREIESLAEQLAKLAVAKNQVENALQGELFDRLPNLSENSVRLPTGIILVVLHRGKYAAMKAIDQTSVARGRGVRYVWWYQPDGTGIFTSESAQTGYSEVREEDTGQATLHLGPIDLAWSFGGDGYGFVYFGPSTRPSMEYSLAILQEIDIARLDAAKLHFVRAPEP